MRLYDLCARCALSNRERVAKLGGKSAFVSLFRSRYRLCSLPSRDRRDGRIVVDKDAEWVCLRVEDVLVERDEIVGREE